MNLRQSGRQAAFTLIEIMIGVAIVAIMSAIAIPAFQKYVYEARRSEAVVMLNAVWKAEQAFRQENGFYRASFSGPTPEGGSTQSLMFSSGARSSRYNLILGQQGTGDGNVYDSFGHLEGAAGAGADPTLPLNVYGVARQDESYIRSRVAIGAEGNIGAYQNKIDALLLLDGKLFLLCDSTKPYSAAEAVLNYNSWGDARCDKDPEDPCVSNPSAPGCGGGGEGPS